MSTTQFEVGQKVTFTQVKQIGRRIKFSSREGVIQNLHPTWAAIKQKSGNLRAVDLDDLRLVGEKSALTEAVQSAFASTPE
jgi:hypothetical protein